MKDRFLKALPPALRSIPPLTGYVVSREPLGSSLIRVRAQGDEYRTLAPTQPGQHLDVLVHGVWPFGGRHYTPSSVNEERGEIELIVHLHGNGPGSAYFTRLRPGDPLTVWGPGGTFTLRHGAHQPVFIGDETTLATWVAMSAACETRGLPEPMGAVQFGCGDHEHALHALNLSLNAVDRSLGEAADEALCQIATEIETATNDACYYLAGRSRTVRAVRSALMTAGVAMRRTRLKSFWTEGQSAL